LNGVTGIAVGMATSIPPHNLGEIVDAIMHLSNEPEASVDDLMQFVKGPDFPTGGIVYNVEDIKQAYVTGRGGMVVRAKTEIVEKKGGKFVILVHEIPYQVNKANLIIKIAELVRDKKILGITDIRDESNKNGIRVVIELKKDSYPKKILNQLFKYTQLQSSFNMNMIALVDDVQPHLLDLKQVLEHFISHRKVIITRRTEYELKIAKARAHILEGLKIALDHIDAVIQTIRSSDTKELALEALISEFGLSELQGKAILEMKLQTLAGLERKKIEDELAEKLALITQLESILADTKKVLKIMQDELAEIKEKYADERRTEVVPYAINSISKKDTIPNEPVIVMLTKENYIKRVDVGLFKAQKRGGKGIIGSTTKEEDEIRLIRYAHNHDEILYFTNKGRVFTLPVYEIPKTSRTAKGQSIVNLLQLQKDEVVTSILQSVGGKLKSDFLFMATEKGTVKKTPAKDFENIRKSGLIAIRLRDDDSLEWVKEVSKDDEILIVSREGKCIRFKEKDVRPMGRSSIGVRGLRLKSKDIAIEMDKVANPQETDLLVVMENGLGKMSKIDSYRLQKRGGTGVKTANITTKTGKIVGAKSIPNGADGDLIMISKSGQVIRMNSSDIPSRGRATQGVYLMRMKPNDKVVSISIVDFIKEVEEVEKQKKEVANQDIQTKIDLPEKEPIQKA
jgi:DNA gyrase subunit A